MLAPIDKSNTRTTPGWRHTVRLQHLELLLDRRLAARNAR